MYCILALCTVCTLLHLHWNTSQLSFVLFRVISCPHPPCCFPSVRGPGQCTDETSICCFCMKLIVFSLHEVMSHKSCLKLQIEKYVTVMDVYLCGIFELIKYFSFGCNFLPFLTTFMAQNLHAYFNGIFLLNISAVYLEGIFPRYISEEYFSGIFGKSIQKKYYSYLVSIISAEYLAYDLPDEVCHVVPMTSLQLCGNMNFTQIHL